MEIGVKFLTKLRMQLSCDPAVPLVGQWATEIPAFSRSTIVTVSYRIRLGVCQYMSR